MDIHTLTAAHLTNARQNRFDPRTEELYYRSTTWTPWPAWAVGKLARAARSALRLLKSRPIRRQPGTAAE